MSWQVYDWGRQGEVLEKLSGPPRDDGYDEARAKVKKWILAGTWGPGEDLHVRDGVAFLEPADPRNRRRRSVQ